jgi:enoyl-CoA hydratase/carnithine racemase
MEWQTLRYEKDGRIARITLNRPELLNALNTPMVRELAEVTQHLAKDPETWVVIVSGAGRAFNSGIDRTALARGEIAESFFYLWAQALDTLEDMDKIVLGILHGYCIGGGLQLALACDLRLAVTDTILGLGATRHGVIPDGAVYRLARVVGLGRAKELALLNNHISAEEGRAMGLVNWVVLPEELEATTQRILGRLFDCSPTAARWTKTLLNRSFHIDPRARVGDILAAERECQASPEIEEANRAWIERRKPRFFP